MRKKQCTYHKAVALDPDGICPIGRAIPYKTMMSEGERAWLRFQRGCEAAGLKPGQYTSFLAGYAAGRQAEQAEENN